MKRRVSSMKIPCRIWLLAATLSVGQAAFFNGNGNYFLFDGPRYSTTKEGN